MHPRILAGLAIAGVTAIALAAQHNSDADRESASTGAKQVALAVLMYASDFDDRLPDKKADVGNIYPYVRTPKVFMPFPKEPAAVTYHCKMSREKTIAVKSAYVFNPALYGVLMTKIKDPATTVMWSYGPQKHLGYVFDGKTLIAFTDGHVKFVGKNETKKLRWNP